MSTIIHGDCLEVLAGMGPDSVDAVVTDPPYGLKFMGKDWDHGLPGVHFWEAVSRVLKPGAHLLAFGGTRTFHRLTCAVEDAGFEIRDCVCWLYGSGFPKSRNLKGEWQGWGTALKPAWEPVIVARKPLIGTVAANVDRYGTGAVNVDGCRIPHNEECRMLPDQHGDSPGNFYAQGGRHGPTLELKPSGRWPANVVLDEAAAAMLDEAVGTRPSGVAVKHNTPVGKVTGRIYPMGNTGVDMTYGDSGGPSRFFYCAKASRAERNAGLGGMPLRRAGSIEGGGGLNSTNDHAYSRNHHPTVKPLSLMRWLVRLVTPPAGTILDPFMGSGTTGVACAQEGFDFIGIEREEEYVEIARRRIEAAEAQMRLEVG